MTESDDTAVALVIFRRPHTTRRVLAAMRKARPSTVFVIADGPRAGRPEEERACRKTRDLIREAIDWDCDIRTNYASTNMGLKNRVESGLDWVFDQVERAIILEDDCVPDPSFFGYCHELLEKYKDNGSVMAIGGTNYQHGRSRTVSDYYFSRYMHCWGWATWRSAWHHYTSQLDRWPVIREQNWLNQLFESDRDVAYWTRIFNEVYSGDIDSWAYVWQYHIWCNGGTCIVPDTNLVTNVGFGEDGTHTLDAAHPSAGLTAHQVDLPLQHPPCIIQHREADRFTQRHNYNPTVLDRIRRKVNRWIQ